MVALGEPAALVTRGIDLGDAKVKRRYAQAGARATYDAARASEPRLLEILSGSDGEARRAAAALLSMFCEDAKKLVPALLERLAREDDPAAAQMILSATSLRILQSQHERRSAARGNGRGDAGTAPHLGGALPR
jgi:hypothetical protein